MKVRTALKINFKNYYYYTAGSEEKYAANHPAWLGQEVGVAQILRLKMRLPGDVHRG